MNNSDLIKKFVRSEISNDDNPIISLSELSDASGINFEQAINALRNAVENIIEFFSKIKIKDDNSDTFCIEIEDKGITIMIDKNKIEEDNLNSKPP